MVHHIVGPTVSVHITAMPPHRLVPWQQFYVGVSPRRLDSFVLLSHRQSRPLSATARLSQPNGVAPIPGLPDAEEENDEPSSKSNREPRWRATLYKMFESAMTTFASLAVLGAAGYGYHIYYKGLVLRKMDQAFQPGDPVLTLASPTPLTSATPASKTGTEQNNADNTFIDRVEQPIIDDILAGRKRGRYWLLIGEKGTGKSSMIIEAMRKVDGTNISMFEAHANLEIFRIRLGKALNYEFHEDYIGSLFSVRGPRDTTALLDIERAFNKLEKIALDRRASKRAPLVMIINTVHLIRNDSDGADLLELIQQRSEQWAASNLITVVLNSDEYWVYERLKQNATRMEVVPVRDLTKPRAIAALAHYRSRYFPHESHTTNHQTYSEVYEKVGGRINYLARVAKAHDMLARSDQILTAEKTWFLNRCGILGTSMDDDVMDQQKFASAAMVMAKALVDLGEKMDKTYDDAVGHILPEIPLFQARQIMTRADFIQQYDHDNLFTIDSNAMVRADSVPMMNAFKEICAEPGFDQYLQDTLTRISAVESIGRTRELTLKDLWIEQSGDQRGAYEMLMKNAKGQVTGQVQLRVKPDPEAEQEDADDDAK